ncbi:glycosyltransferase [Aeromonas caviae]|uniref:glycosyltransferase n=1 Tax=Aeromonas caviae TaxID=648 RepID=UPI0029D956BE|nr:glycosyltransferase [Aeromonas caviae]MDX7762179.1 glycosyltransferase [Aeromonas caviae]
MTENYNSVAVIMSVYRTDSFQFVKDAINSILSQTYPCTLYIYQDGPVSTEISYLLDTISYANDNVIFFVSDVNHGLAHALNFMIDHVVSEGYEFIARMDSDDISRPTRIAKQIAYFKQHPDVDVLGASCREFGASYALVEKHLPKSHAELVDFSVARCPFIHPTVMFRTRLFFNGVRYPTDTKLTEDMALWLKLIEDGYRLANLNEVLLDYRLNANAVKRRQGIGKAISEFDIRFKHMRAMKKNSPKNIILISSRLLFHVLPLPIIKMLYKFAR